MTGRAAQINVFLQGSGWADATRTLVAGDASHRRYERLQRADNETAILMDAPVAGLEETQCFINVSDHLRQSGLSAPRILARDVPAGLLIIEDFGDDLFADLMAKNPALQIPLYRAATDVLIHLQKTAKPDLPTCDSEWLIEMIMPLFEWYAPRTNQRDIEHFKTLFLPHANRVTAGQTVMILRDYHAQNLLLLSDRAGTQSVGILDFQDALLGHPAYDLVSILQDARRDVSEIIEAKMVAYMLDHTSHDAASFRAAYAVLGLQRNLRILGIFARLCLRDGKSQYVDFIPRVWRYIERNLAHPDLAGLSSFLMSILPNPTPDFLEHMKNQCQPTDSQL